MMAQMVVGSVSRNQHQSSVAENGGSKMGSKT